MEHDRRKQDNARDLDAIKKVVDKTASEVHTQSHTLIEMAVTLTAIKAKLDGLGIPGAPLVQTGALKTATAAAKAKRGEVGKVVDENKT